MPRLIRTQRLEQLRTANVALEHGSSTLAYMSVPARVWTTRGEAYRGKATTAQLVQIADDAAAAGSQAEVCQYTT